MYHHLCSHSILILILLNIYCYSLPIPYVDQNDQDHSSSAIHFDEEDMMKAYKNDQLNYYNILCAFYNDCYNTDHRDIINTAIIKPKRITSSLFHGIPKFGKRAFVSAFSGIPKFG
jgi:hypothetical protein